MSFKVGQNSSLTRVNVPSAFAGRIWNSPIDNEINSKLNTGGVLTWDNIVQNWTLGPLVQGPTGPGGGSLLNHLSAINSTGSLVINNTGDTIISPSEILYNPNNSWTINFEGGPPGNETYSLLYSGPTGSFIIHTTCLIEKISANTSRNLRYATRKNNNYIPTAGYPVLVQPLSNGEIVEVSTHDITTLSNGDKIYIVAVASASSSFQIPSGGGVGAFATINIVQIA